MKRNSHTEDEEIYGFAVCLEVATVLMMRFYSEQNAWKMNAFHVNLPPCALFCKQKLILTDNLTILKQHRSYFERPSQNDIPPCKSKVFKIYLKAPETMHKKEHFFCF